MTNNRFVATTGLKAIARQTQRDYRQVKEQQFVSSPILAKHS
jgi:hypothetical protein